MSICGVACLDIEAHRLTLAGMAKTGRPKAELMVTEDERITLERWARRATSAQALAQRCRIVLACAEGKDNKEVAAGLGVHQVTVGQWRSSFIRSRLDGLADEDRPGRPASVTLDQVEALIVATLEETPKNATRWSRAARRARDLPALHAAAAGWFAEHGYPAEAVGHAMAAENWSLAARPLSDHWLGLVLEARAAKVHELLTGFPSRVRASDPELASVAVGVELARGSLDEAERHLALADRGASSVPVHRRARFEVTLAVLRLQLARQRSGHCRGCPGARPRSRRTRGAAPPVSVPPRTAAATPAGSHRPRRSHLPDPRPARRDGRSRITTGPAPAPR